jgi:Mce-associated membrane protein
MADDVDAPELSMLDDVDMADMDVGEQDSGSETEQDGSPQAVVRHHFPGALRALAVSFAVVLALAGLVGWLGYRAHESRQAQDKRNMFLEAGRNGALNLTTISSTEADADVQRILDSSTGTFHDDFQQRAPSFVDVVKQAQSKSQGVITEAGLQSEDGNQAQVLVAVAVNTTLAGAAQPPRAWRMRITVQQAGGGAKVSNVAFVP